MAASPGPETGVDRPSLLFALVAADDAEVELAPLQVDPHHLDVDLVAQPVATLAAAAAQGVRRLVGRLPLLPSFSRPSLNRPATAPVRRGEPGQETKPCSAPRKRSTKNCWPCAAGAATRPPWKSWCGPGKSDSSTSSAGWWTTRPTPGTSSRKPGSASCPASAPSGSRAAWPRGCTASPATLPSTTARS